MKLSDNLHDYTQQLLDHVRGEDELDMVLNASGAAGVDLGAFGRLARLKLAMHFGQKKVGLSFCTYQVGIYSLPLIPPK